MILAKWCPPCKIVWQTRRVTCPNCRRRFADQDAFAISKGKATRQEIAPDPYLSYWCGKGKDGQPFNDHSSCHDSGCECRCHQRALQSNGGHS